MNVLDYIESQLLLCLCSMLRTEGRPACECHHFGGEVPPVGDRCSRNSAGENGQVWVRRISQSIELNTQNLTFTGGVCNANWQARIELGIYRCISAIPDDHGNAPRPEAYDADRELLVADRATLAQVLCCWPLTGPVPPGFTYDLSGISLRGAEIEPMGPTGGCAGSSLQVHLTAPIIATELAPEALYVSGPAGSL